MKRILIEIPPSAGSERAREAMRVAAGLSQQPGLEIGLRINNLPFPQEDAAAREYLGLFAEKGILLQVGPEWEPFLSPSLRAIYSPSTLSIATLNFDLRVPF